MDTTAIDAILDRMGSPQLTRLAWTARGLRDARAKRAETAEEPAERGMWLDEADFYNELAIVLSDRIQHTVQRQRRISIADNPFRVVRVEVAADDS
jgi:hypothetical protein